MQTPPPLLQPSQSLVAFSVAFRYWLKLGFINFGGPAGQIALMHRDLVERQRWISEKRFLHALNYCMFLPGPEAQQLATYIGWLLHGTWGGIVAGGLFVLPSIFILISLSWIYMAFGSAPAVNAIFYGMKPAVVAIVACAVLRLGSRAIKNWAALAIATLAFVALMFFHVPFPLVVVGAGLLGLLGARFAPWLVRGGHAPGQSQETSYGPAVIDDHHEIMPHTRLSYGRFLVQLAVGLLLWAIPVALLALWQGWDGTHTRMALFFSQ